MGDEGIFGDDEAALVVVAAIDEDEEVAEVDIAEGVLGFAFVAAETEPKDVDGRPGVVKRKMAGGAGDGVAAIAADDEGGLDFNRAGGGVGADACDSALGFDEAGGFVLHEEVEGREFCGLRGEEVEEVPLRHERDELCMGGEVGEVAEGKRPAADGHGKLGELLVGECEEFVEQTQFVEKLECGGVNGVSTEVAEEVFVFFEDGDIDFGAGEEEAEHDAGGASADDAAGGF